MIYYILLVLIILVLRQFVLSMRFHAQREKFENRCCYLVWLIIVFLAAFRSAKVGADTYKYMEDYLFMPLYDFADISDRYEGYLGYYYVSKLFSLVDMPLSVWFGFTEGLYAYSMMGFIKRYSSDKLFSILVFVTIGLFTFSMAGLKQVMSMSLMMLAFLQFIDKKYWMMVLLGLMGYLCHPTGLIFLAAFPLYFIRGKKSFIRLIVAIIVFICLYGEFFLSNMVSVLDNDHFESYLVRDNSYTYVTLIFYVSIVTIAYWGYKSYAISKLQDAKMVLGFSLIALGMQVLAGISPNMFRLAYLYCPFMMILIPNACMFASTVKRNRMQFLIIGSIVFYFLYTNRNTPYSFI